MSKDDAHTIDASMYELVAQRLGRPPRGLRAVPVVDAEGGPMVIRVASLVDDKPFPTLFWLIDPTLNLRIDREEATGCIALLQAQIDADEALRAAMANDHERHIALRKSFVTATEYSTLQKRGQVDALDKRGIGGIADFSRVRCLHTWYAAHLVEANTLGRLLDARWRSASTAG